jgi:hypothetical protein
MPASIILSPDTALTDNGTSISDSARFCAVTITSSKAKFWADAGIANARAATSGETVLTVLEIIFEYIGKSSHLGGGFVIIKKPVLQ